VLLKSDLYIDLLVYFEAMFVILGRTSSLFVRRGNKFRIKF